MAKIKAGDTVVIEAMVSLVSKDGSGVTIRIPQYRYPVTVPVNSVAAQPSEIRRVEAEPADAVNRKPKGRRNWPAFWVVSRHGEPMPRG